MANDLVPNSEEYEWARRDADHLIDAMAYGLAASKIIFDIDYGISIIGVDIGKRSYSVYTQYCEMAARMPASAQIVEGEVISKRIISDGN